jgi:hypothetical protein
MSQHQKTWVENDATKTPPVALEELPYCTDHTLLRLFILEFLGAIIESIGVYDEAIGKYIVESNEAPAIRLRAAFPYTEFEWSYHPGYVFKYFFQCTSPTGTGRLYEKVTHLVQTVSNLTGAFVVDVLQALRKLPATRFIALSMLNEALFDDPVSPSGRKTDMKKGRSLHNKTRHGELCIHEAGLRPRDVVEDFTAGQFVPSTLHFHIIPTSFQFCLSTHTRAHTLTHPGRHRELAEQLVESTFLTKKSIAIKTLRGQLVEPDVFKLLQQIGDGYAGVYV